MLGYLLIPLSGALPGGSGDRPSPMVSEALALLALGLVRPWGEIVPSWVGLVGAAAVPAGAATGGDSGDLHGETLRS